MYNQDLPWFREKNAQVLPLQGPEVYIHDLLPSHWLGDSLAHHCRPTHHTINASNKQPWLLVFQAHLMISASNKHPSWSLFDE